MERGELEWRWRAECTLVRVLLCGQFPVVFCEDFLIFEVVGFLVFFFFNFFNIFVKDIDLSLGFGYFYWSPYMVIPKPQFLEKMLTNKNKKNNSSSQWLSNAYPVPQGACPQLEKQSDHRILPLSQCPGLPKVGRGSE